MLQWTPMVTMKDIEKEAIKQALLHHSGNITAAAEDLGISHQTVRNRFKSLFTEEERRYIRPINEWWK